MDWKQPIFSTVIKLFPDLPRKLEMAEMHIDPKDFVVSVVLNALGPSLILTIFAIKLAPSFNISFVTLILGGLILFAVLFFIGIKVVDLRISRKERDRLR